MKQNIDFFMFRDAFHDCGRGDQFPKGLRSLYDYLIEYEESTGQETTLDVIALCCEFTECYLSEALRDYGLETLEDLEERTQVIMVRESEDPRECIIIYQDF